MRNFEDYLHQQIDDFATYYEGSPCVDNIIELKKKTDNWIQQRTKAIHDFYKSNKEDKISFVCKHDTFQMRLTFYRNGYVRIILHHKNHQETLLKDKNIITDYCLDYGSVYFIESEFGWKIGKAKDVSLRRKAFGVQLPFQFALRYHIKTHDKSILEKYFHDYFKEKQINGEWYLITKEDIENAVSGRSDLRLSGYPPDDKIFINRDYLNKINIL